MRRGRLRKRITEYANGRLTEKEAPNGFWSGYPHRCQRQRLPGAVPTGTMDKLTSKLCPSELTAEDNKVAAEAIASAKD